MPQIVGPIPIDNPVFWFLLIFWMIVFLFTMVFYKLVGRGLVKFMVWKKNIWIKIFRSESYKQFLDNVGYRQIETEKGIRNSQKVVLILSIICFVFLILILILAFVSPGGI